MTNWLHPVVDSLQQWHILQWILNYAMTIIQEQPYDHEEWIQFAKWCWKRGNTSFNINPNPKPKWFVFSVLSYLSLHMQMRIGFVIVLPTVIRMYQLCWVSSYSALIRHDANILHSLSQHHSPSSADHHLTWPRTIYILGWRLGVQTCWTMINDTRESCWFI